MRLGRVARTEGVEWFLHCRFREGSLSVSKERMGQLDMALLRALKELMCDESVGGLTLLPRAGEATLPPAIAACPSIAQAPRIAILFHPLLRPADDGQYGSFSFLPRRRVGQIGIS